MQLYQFEVKGLLHERWTKTFVGMNFERTTRGTTILQGMVKDQAALHGIIVRIRDLGLPLLAVSRIGADPTGISGPKLDIAPRLTHTL